MTEVLSGVSAERVTGVSWRKSRYSGAQGNCVEVAHLPTGEVAVRNSRDPDGPALIYTTEEMAAFVAGVKDGDFDVPPSETYPPADHAVRTMKPAEATARYRAMGAELQSVTNTFLAGETILDREDTERLLRVLGAVVLLHRMHRVDLHGRCSICRTKPRLRWHPSARHDVCSVYAALGLHLGRSLAAFGDSVE